MIQGKHLIFYDGECGFCDQVVQFILKIDKDKIFMFAPLQGKTAQENLKNLSAEFKTGESVILIENYNSDHSKTYILGKAAFRTLWLIGGAWWFVGWINFLPSFLYDWGYKLVAKNRKRIFSNESCVIPTLEEKKRFFD